MRSVHLKNMLARHHYPVVEDADGPETLLREHEVVVLFFAGDPRRHPESDDVALILPELERAFGGRFRPALVATAAEEALRARYGFAEWPALVFLERRGWLGTITRVRDWQDYLSCVEAILGAEPRPAPGLGIPLDGRTAT